MIPHACLQRLESELGPAEMQGEFYCWLLPVNGVPVELRLRPVGPGVMGVWLLYQANPEKAVMRVLPCQSTGDIETILRRVQEVRRGGPWQD